VDSAHDTGTREILACDESFFTALLAADHDLLGTILAGDFVIIDVLSGQVARRGELLGAISSGQLRFAEIRRHTAERSVRRRDSAAVVVGRTTMVIRYREDELTVHNRYTHLYARENHRWRLLSAQGTPITAPRTPGGRPSLFCDTALAQRIEQAEAQLIAEASQAAHRRAGTAGFIIPVAGGVASFAEPGSPYNKVAGLGFGGLPSTAALEEIEQAFAARGAPVQIELAHLADPAVGAFLTERCYELASFENVLGRALNGEHERVTPPGIEVRPSGEEELDAWVDVVVDGGLHPDTQGVPQHEEFPREVLASAERDGGAVTGMRRYVALRDGVIVGGASFRAADGIAQFTGAATVPAHRRRGIQTALLSARLADAAAAGCDVAVITTAPGSKSQQNAQRQGFDLLYTRAVLVRHP